MGQEKLELKVGLFVILSLAVLTALVFKAGNFKTDAGYTVRFRFTSVRGIESGAPVRLAGVNVGTVRDVNVVKDAESQTQAELLVWLRKDVTIEEDALVRISSLGVLGDKFVEIVPGIHEKRLEEGGVISGQTPIVMEDVAESSRQLISNIDTAIANVNELVGDPAFKKSVKQTFQQTEAFSTDLKEMSANIKEIGENLKDASKSAKIILGRIRDGEGSVGRLLKDDKIAKDLEGFVADIKAHPWKLLKKG